MSIHKKNTPHSRDNLIDTLKGVLIIMVVLGHFIFPLIANPWYKTLYLFLYAVHMPLFSFLSGYLYRKRSVSEQTRRLLIPYFFFQGVYLTVSVLFLGAKPGLIWVINPFGHLWYLWVLFFWGFLFELLKQYNGYFLIALTAGICVQMIESASLLELTRMLTFFPFFLFGIRIQNCSLSVVHMFISKQVAVLNLCSILFMVFIVQRWIDYRWLLRMDSYTVLGFPNLWGGLLSLSLYLVSGVLCLIVIRLFLFSQSFFARVGKMSLYVYVWHYEVVLLIYRFVFPYVSSTAGEIVALVGTVVLSVLLSHQFVKKHTDKLLAVFQSMILKKVDMT